MRHALRAENRIEMVVETHAPQEPAGQRQGLIAADRELAAPMPQRRQRSPNTRQYARPPADNTRMMRKVPSYVLRLRAATDGSFEQLDESVSDCRTDDRLGERAQAVSRPNVVDARLDGAKAVDERSIEIEDDGPRPPIARAGLGLAVL
jgi:hypothetical protein